MQGFVGQVSAYTPTLTAQRFVVLIRDAALSRRVGASVVGRNMVFSFSKRSFEVELKPGDLAIVFNSKTEQPFAAPGLGAARK